MASLDPSYTTDQGFGVLFVFCLVIGLVGIGFVPGLLGFTADMLQLTRYRRAKLRATR